MDVYIKSGKARTAYVVMKTNIYNFKITTQNQMFVLLACLSSLIEYELDKFRNLVVFIFISYNLGEFLTPSKRFW